MLKLLSILTDYPMHYILSGFLVISRKKSANSIHIPLTFHLSRITLQISQGQFLLAYYHEALGCDYWSFRTCCGCSAAPRHVIHGYRTLYGP